MAGKAEVPVVVGPLWRRNAIGWRVDTELARSVTTSSQSSPAGSDAQLRTDLVKGRGREVDW